MKKTKTETVTKEVERVTGIFCDACNHDFRHDELYYRVHTHNMLYGNDSIDYHEHLDFCSMDCLMPHLQDYYNNPENTMDYDIACRRFSKEAKW